MLFVLTFVATSAETTLPRAAATDVGMSAERLENLKEVMARHLASGTSPVGIVVAIARRGHLVFLHASGVMNIESKRPLATDSIFRLMSATKVIVAAAVLTLVDEGRVRLQDPVSRYVPEFATLTVGTASGSRDRAKRAITLQDLLTHTSGLGSGASFIETMRVADVGPGTTLAEAVRRFPQAPLEFQPGDHWSYSPVAGFDTLLRVAEIVSGQPADELLRRRIFQPLAMTDTRFWTPAADTNPRLATLYDQTRDGLKPLANPGGSEKYFSGGGGLMSTAEDLAQFGQMLLNGGELNGVRLLKASTVSQMHSSVVKEFASPFDGIKPGRTFGLGVQVINDPTAVGYRVGRGTFGWDGALGSIETHVWIDPASNIVGVVFLQGQDVSVFRDVEAAVMQSIVR